MIIWGCKRIKPWGVHGSDCQKTFREVWRAVALQMQGESGDMRGGFASLRSKVSLRRLSKNLFGWFGGPQPSKCNPNPATCAADSEALRSKVSLHCFPPGRLIEPRGKQCKYSEKDAAGGLFRHAEPDAGKLHQAFCMASICSYRFFVEQSAQPCGLPAMLCLYE